MLCSRSSHSLDASGDVPVLSRLDRGDDDDNRGCENVSSKDCCCSGAVQEARDSMAPSHCSIFREPGAHGPPPLSAHLLDDAAVSWDFCCSAQIAHKGTKVRGNYRAPAATPASAEAHQCMMCEAKCHCGGRANRTFKGLSSWTCLVRPQGCSLGCTQGESGLSLSAG